MSYQGNQVVYLENGVTIINGQCARKSKGTPRPDWCLSALWNIMTRPEQQQARTEWAEYLALNPPPAASATKPRYILLEYC